MNYEPSNIKAELDARRQEKCQDMVANIVFQVIWTLGVICACHYYFVGRFY